MSDPNPLMAIVGNVQAYPPLEPDFSELQMVTVTLNYDGSPVTNGVTYVRKSDWSRAMMPRNNGNPPHTYSTPEYVRAEGNKLKRKHVIELTDLAKKTKQEWEKENKEALDTEDPIAVHLEYRKHYWNFILTTFLSALNDIDKKNLDIEKVEFHEMMVNIYEFDKGADWATYELWSVPYLIYNLFGSFEEWEEFNDTEHLLCKSLKYLAEEGIYKNNVKKILAYFYHCQKHYPVNTRFLYRISNEFEADVWDWIVCSYHNNLEKYVIAQEEIRGETFLKPEYDSLPSFLDRREYYETRKYKDVENVFLYECYEFFKNHVHIESEVLNADFQDILTHPMESQKNAELEYFQKVLGLDDQLMIIF